MKELVSGLVCCDLVTNSKDEYDLSFNMGRLLGAILILGIGCVIGVFFLP